MSILKNSSLTKKSGKLKDFFDVKKNILKFIILFFFQKEELNKAKKTQNNERKQEITEFMD